MDKLKIKNTVIAVIMCIAMVLPITACGNNSEIQQQIFAMDTIMNLTAYGNNAESGVQAAADVIKALDNMLDPDNSDSYVSLLNSAKGKEIVVPPQIYEMLSTAYSVYSESGGALDLSVYPLYEAWGEFKEETGRIPDDDEISKLLKTMGFGDISITSFPGESGYSVELPKDTKLSFGAVAKGYASNCAIEAMKKAGVESAVISLGGNVQTLGVKPDGSNWTIAVEDPSNTGDYLGTLSVGETAIITSGSYQRFFTGEDGVKYHHLIDPDTGRPSKSNLLSVTIVCPDGTLADCLSTAMFILGEEDALQYWRGNPGFDMILVTNDNRVICTSGLIESFQPANTDKYTVTTIE